MRSLYYKIPSEWRPVCLAALMILAGAGLYFFGNNLVFKVAVCILLVIILLVAHQAWLSQKSAKALQRLLAGAAMLLGLSYFKLDPYLQTWLTPVLKTMFPELPLDMKLRIGSPLVLLLTLTIIGLVLYLLRDKTIMKIAGTETERLFPGKSLNQRMLKVAEMLKEDLDRMDREMSWSDDHYIPLEAEVEIIRSQYRQRKIGDLLSAVRKNVDKKIFLVLGDPGSGKSVALRTLTRSLFAEVPATGKIPLYINLKEWKDHRAWTIEAPPNDGDVLGFIKDNLQHRVDSTSRQFLDEYFDKMYANGRFFFILDSFDEMPDLLDADEASWIIDSLSRALYFLFRSTDSRGILASRIFRKPSREFIQAITLEIRPLSERKIQQSFTNDVHGLSMEVVMHLLKDRQDLVPVARNPFTAALLIKYIREHHNQLPDFKANLYEGFIESRLSEFQKQLTAAGLTPDRVRQFCIDLAYHIFTTSGLGLEITLAELKSDLTDYSNEEIDQLTQILEQAKICRLSRGDKRLSFVHRRFNEYFFVLYLLKNAAPIDPMHIAQDTRWREPIVLYCEVARPASIQGIIDFCWEKIQELADSDTLTDQARYSRSIHCLRFLAEAFRAKPVLLAPIQKDLQTLILSQIGWQNRGNILLMKLCVEATGILDTAQLQAVVLTALEVKIPWINEVALRACRHLPVIEPALEEKARNFISQIDLFELAYQKEELSFSFSLSDAFRNVRRYLKMRVIEQRVFFMGLALLLLLNPLSFFAFMCTYLGMNFISPDSPSDRNSSLNSLRFSASLVLVWTQYGYFRDHKLPAFTSVIWLFPPKDQFMVYATGMVVAVLCFFPWLSLARQTKALTRIKERNMKENAVFVGMILLYGGAGVGAVILIVYLSMKVHLEFWVLAIFLLFGSYFLLKDPFFSFKDRLLVAKLMKRVRSANPALTREEIVGHLNRLRTERGRARYVRQLRDNSIVPSGLWPTGVPPNFLNDDASIMLAQLEEKWLNF